MKVINLYGGPGSGKSTTAAGLFYKMKLKHMSVELVSEYAKKLLYSNRLDGMLDQQEYIFAKQNALLHNLRDRVDYVITDSPLLLSNIYSSDDWACVKPFRELVSQIYDTYDNMDILLTRPTTFEVDGRRHNEDESQALDKQINSMLSNRGDNFFLFKCNDTVVDDIMHFLFRTDEAA